MHQEQMYHACRDDVMPLRMGCAFSTLLPTSFVCKPVAFDLENGQKIQQLLCITRLCGEAFQAWDVDLGKTAPWRVTWDSGTFFFLETRSYCRDPIEIQQLR